MFFIDFRESGKREDTEYIKGQKYSQGWQSPKFLFYFIIFDGFLKIKNIVRLIKME